MDHPLGVKRIRILETVDDLEMLEVLGRVNALAMVYSLEQVDTNERAAMILPQEMRMVSPHWMDLVPARRVGMAPQGPWDVLVSPSCLEVAD
jgi:hypothetical protein